MTDEEFRNPESIHDAVALALTGSKTWAAVFNAGLAQELSQAALELLAAPRPLDEWHEDYGDVLWWRFPIVEPPYVGSPLHVGGWPGYHTHWTPIIVPWLRGENA